MQYGLNLKGYNWIFFKIREIIVPRQTRFDRINYAGLSIAVRSLYENGEDNVKHVMQSHSCQM